MRQAPRTPVRTCIGCRSRRGQHELLRLARTPEGIRFDPDGRLPGRGAYLCPDNACVDAAARRDAGTVRRALRGGSVAEATAALQAARARTVQHQVPDGTVRSEST